jgi:hypothetical protein
MNIFSFPLPVIIGTSDPAGAEEVGASSVAGTAEEMGASSESLDPPHAATLAMITRALENLNTRSLLDDRLLGCIFKSG